MVALKQALLIIDVQNDYFPGGRFELHQPLKALANVERALRMFREKKLPVIHVQHISTREGAAFFLPGTEGAEIHKNLAPAAGEHLVVKGAPNAFFRTNLAEILNESGVTDLVVCGMMSHICVDTTVRACFDFGLGVTLLADACTTRDLAGEGKTIPAETVHAVYMASLNGTFAKVVKTDELKI